MMEEGLLWCVLGFDVERKRCSCVPKQDNQKLITNFVAMLCVLCALLVTLLLVCVVWRAKDISDEAYKRGDCCRGGEGGCLYGWVGDQAVKELGRLCMGRKTTCSDRTGAVGKDATTLFPVVLCYA